MPEPIDPNRTPIWRQVALAVATVLVVAGVLTQAGLIFTTNATKVAAFAVAFIGLNLLTHHLGLLSLGQGAMLGIGAVAGLHAVRDFGLPPTLIPFAGLLAGFVLGAIIAVPSLRLPKPYLALLTLSVAVAVPIVIRQLDGPLPVTLDAEYLPPSWTGIAERDEHKWEFILVVAYAIPILWILHRLLNGPVGRAFIASRDDPTAAAAFGIPVRRLRLFGVALSGGLAGMAGGLTVIPVNITDSPLYPESLSIKMFAVTVAFGGRRVLSTVTSAIFLIMLPVWLNDRNWVVPSGWDGLFKSEGFIYAVLLLATAHLTKGKGFPHLLAERRRARQLGMTPDPIISIGRYRIL